MSNWLRFFYLGSRFLRNHVIMGYKANKLFTINRPLMLSKRQIMTTVILQTVLLNQMETLQAEAELQPNKGPKSEERPASLRKWTTPPNLFIVCQDFLPSPLQQTESRGDTYEALKLFSESNLWLKSGWVNVSTEVRPAIWDQLIQLRCIWDHSFELLS